MTNLHNWFECKVKYIKTGEDGKDKKVSESYMIDAASYTEAEAKIYEIMEQIVSGPFKVSAIKGSNVSEIIESDNTGADKYFKVKVSIIDADEATGKERRSNQYVLTHGEDIHEALALTHENFSTYVVPFEIAQISDTNIIEVIPHKEEK